jgi:hypothetical protein
MIFTALHSKRTGAVTVAVHSSRRQTDGQVKQDIGAQETRMERLDFRLSNSLQGYNDIYVVR